ncbi:MAG: NPCBM/NEW2 domain-containing protein [Candidatus Poribacteria bacterium]|nr:NPCBM/NEW2 domain-containing protein [Candidatus Poribacteria bacterium]
MKKTDLIFIILLYGLTFTVVNMPTAAANRMVKVVYFVPRDRPFQWNIPAALDTQIKAVQRFYAEQMEAHGYSRKTFNLENDAGGKLIVYPVTGNFNDAYYHTDTLSKITDEIDDQYDIEKDIYIVIVDVSTERIQGNCGIAPFDGGPMMVPATGDCVQGDHGVDLIAHELGHALNLEHDFRDDAYIMSYGAAREQLSACAASMLNVNPFFNQGGNAGNIANALATIQMLTPLTYPANEENWTLRFSVSDANSIHQVQFLLSIPGEATSLMSCQNFNNIQNTTVKFDMPTGATIAPVNNVYIRVVDQNGNVSGKSWTLSATKTTETKTINTDRTETYLTLTYDSPDALIPTNPSTEWAGWQERLTWEKTPDGLMPRKPNGFMDPIRAGYKHLLDHQWDYWSYAHAVSRIVYDLEGRDYAKFDAFFYMPNPCGSIASVEFICLADGAEIYNSGVLRGAQAKNINISFDIPAGTRTLIINVTDAGDGNGCDHFIIANAHLLHRKPLITEFNNYTDVNNDGFVNIVDLVIVASRYGEKIAGNPHPNPDVNRDGIVDIKDIILITQGMPPIDGAPPLPNAHRSILNSEDWQKAYAVLPNTVVNRGIAVFNLLFGPVVPTKTLLLENYPNPFNPETWIPYQLGLPANVAITIYAADGQVVRKLDLGHQNAGNYVNRSRAAYWDGKNALGESVSSGIYFYALTAGEFVATRRMLIRK